MVDTFSGFTKRPGFGFLSRRAKRTVFVVVLGWDAVRKSYFFRTVPFA